MSNSEIQWKIDVVGKFTELLNNGIWDLIKLEHEVAIRDFKATYGLDDFSTTISFTYNQGNYHISGIVKGVDQ